MDKNQFLLDGINKVNEALEPLDKFIDATQIDKDPQSVAICVEMNKFITAYHNFCDYIVDLGTKQSGGN